MKITHNLIPGSPEWHEFRLQHGGASEAAAMLGMDPNVTRAELLRMKHTGLAREFSDWLQRNVLDKGHEVEALARPHAEAFGGAELFPVVMSDGYPSASTDGLTLYADPEWGWECKQWSEERAACLRAGRLPDKDAPQVQQEMMVSGASRWLFTVTDGTPEKTLHLWVDADPAWHQRLRDGWAMFERDLAAYTLPESAEPAAVGKAPESLPALRIEVTGAVTASNLAEFKATALATIRSVNRTLTTDQDFADAEKAVKWCADVESRIAAAKEHALSQTATIDALFKTLDDIKAEAKTVRLDLDKLVARRKTEVKEEAVAKARRALDAHIAALNAEIAPMRVPQPAADFAGAIKGLKSFASMQDKIDGALTVAKIAAEADARAIRSNLAVFKEAAAGFEFLFADLHTLVHKPADDFGPLVAARVVQHRAAEAARQAAEAATKAALEAAAAPVATPVAAPVPQAAPAPAIRAAAPAPSADEPATLNLGAICGRLGVTLTAQFLADVLHIAPARTDKASKLYAERQFSLICSQLISHVGAMAELYQGEPACARMTTA